MTKFQQANKKEKEENEICEISWAKN